MLASFGIGSGVQVNAISNIMNNTFDLGTVNLFGQDASVISIIVGVLVAAITAVVIFGGIKSISRVCELLVPFMAVFYVLGCLIILGMNFDVLGIAAFAYSTILGWSYYGERCVEYLFGRGGMIPYKLIFVFILLIGPVIKLDLVWTMADIFNALMSIPNLIAVVVLSPVVVKETNYYLYGNRLDEYDKTKLPVVNK